MYVPLSTTTQYFFSKFPPNIQGIASRRNLRRIHFEGISSIPVHFSGTLLMTGHHHLKDNIYISEACGNYTHCYEKQEKNLKMKWTAKINKNYFQIVFEEHVILWYSINLMCNITIIYILYMQKQRLRTVNSIWEIAQLVNDKAGILTLI